MIYQHSKKQENNVLIYLDDVLMVVAFQEIIKLWITECLKVLRISHLLCENKIGHILPESLSLFFNRTKKTIILKG